MRELRNVYIDRMEATPADEVEMANEVFATIKDHLVDSPELNKLKKEIQWDVFWDIVDEIAFKSGIDPKSEKNPKRINKLNPNAIQGIKDWTPPGFGPGYVGFYMPTLNGIVFDYDKAKKNVSNFDVNSKLLIAQLLFHELLHAAAATNIHREVISSGPAVISRQEVHGAYSSHSSIKGLEKGKLKFENEDNRFSFLNEAITDRLAFDVAIEYSKRTGAFTNKEIEDFNKQFVNNDKRPYSVLVKYLKKMCDVVADKAGIGSGTAVWDAFVRGVFYVGNLNDPEVKKWFAGAFSPAFLDELGKAEKFEDFYQVMKKYNIQLDNPKDDKDQVKLVGI